MLSALVATVLALGAEGLSPFAPPQKPAPHVVRLLAPSGAFEAAALRQFERESGYAVAYDAYGDPARALAAMKEASYDVVILPGPELARAVAAGELRPIEKSRVANAERIAPAVAAKLASYEAGGAYGLAWGWTATGLLYDADKAQPALGRAPNSWNDAINPDVSRKLASCGVALPDSRDDMFIVAWRLLGVNPARIRDRDVKEAADLILRARAAVRLPDSPDPVTAIARGVVCFTLGGSAQAEVARRRSREGGAGLDIAFALPQEGAPMTIQALAEPRAGQHPLQASELIGFLLRPAIAERATALAGLTSAEEKASPEIFRALWPVGLYDAAILPIVEREWARIQASEQAQRKAKGKGKAPSPAKPPAPTKSATKPTRTKG